MLNGDNLPDDLYSAAQVRCLDRIAITDLGIGSYGLMQRAAAFSYQVLKQEWPWAKSIAVICGGGNNAGDGYVLAKLAVADHKQAAVVNLVEPKTLQGDASVAYHDLLATKLIPSTFSETVFAGVDVIVDAIFGIGLDRNLSDQYKQIIHAINTNDQPILALDMPSGLNADTGQAMGIAIRATVTASFIALKRGLFTADGPEYAGKIRFDHLAIPSAIRQKIDGQFVRRLKFKELQSVLKRRPRNSHKGQFGHVLLIGGETGYLGAIRMAAEAAARVGAGLVSVATHPSHANMISVIRPEVMAHGVSTATELVALIRRANVIAIGPGLGQSKWARSLFARVLESSRPLIIDADGLNLLAAEGQGSARWIITPHAGEAARLLGTVPSTIQSDRFAALALLHEKYQGPVVLKGCGSLLADTKGDFFVNDGGNPGMASAGMGDVLTGIIAGLVAQGIDLDHASKLGVCLHTQAADRVAAKAGERGLLALDLMPHLHALVNP